MHSETWRRGAASMLHLPWSQLSPRNSHFQTSKETEWQKWPAIICIVLSEGDLAFFQESHSPQRSLEENETDVEIEAATENKPVEEIMKILSCFFGSTWQKFGSGAKQGEAERNWHNWTPTPVPLVPSPKALSVVCSSSRGVVTSGVKWAWERNGKAGGKVTFPRTPPSVLAFFFCFSITNTQFSNCIFVLLAKLNLIKLNFQAESVLPEIITL